MGACCKSPRCSMSLILLLCGTLNTRLPNLCHPVLGYVLCYNENQMVCIRICGAATNGLILIICVCPWMFFLIQEKGKIYSWLKTQFKMHIYKRLINTQESRGDILLNWSINLNTKVQLIWKTRQQNGSKIHRSPKANLTDIEMNEIQGDFKNWGSKWSVRQKKRQIIE